MSAEPVPLFLDIECEPWPDDGDLHLWSARDDGDDSYHVATVSGDLGTEERNATARRMVACWNACEDLPTKTLEDGKVLSLLGATHDLIEAATAILAANEAGDGNFDHAFGQDLMDRLKAVVEKATGQPSPTPHHSHSPFAKQRT